MGEGEDGTNRTNFTPRRGERIDQSTDDALRERTPVVGRPEIDLEFEWRKLCHACGKRKRFNAAICDECRRRHDI